MKRAEHYSCTQPALAASQKSIGNATLLFLIVYNKQF